ncbi:MAG TPA: nucleotide exchange factor GrpE [Candidatus Deferrimicrobiaceae bacterium]|nr:nucleotide exchange factor GrpE [Candidatus Deferrimicrobiaceae bacterium]
MDRTGRTTRAQERAGAIDVSPARLAAEIERITRERDKARREAEALRARLEQAPPNDGAEDLETLRREREEYLAALQRERAEFQNFRRRSTEEREAMLGLAGEDLIRKVLALADDFDRAIEHRPTTIAEDAWVEGIAAIDRKLRQLLESEGVTPIDAAPGTRFDPRSHEAVANVPGTGRAGGEIVEELRRGYRLRDRVIRPALVAVAAEAAEEADAGSSEAQPPIH